MTFFKLENINGGMNLTRNIADNEATEALNGYYDEEGIFTKRSGNVAGNLISTNSIKNISTFQEAGWSGVDTKTDIRTMESGETWTGGSARTDVYYAGSQSRALTTAMAEGDYYVMYSTVALDLSDATKPYIAVYYYSGLPFELILETSSENYYELNSSETFNDTTVKTGWKRLILPKANFTSTGSPSWATITKVKWQRYYPGTPPFERFVTVDQLELSTGIYSDTYLYKTGSQGLRIYNQSAKTTKLSNVVVDLTGSGATDTISFWVYSSSNQTLSSSYIKFEKNTDPTNYAAQVAIGTVTSGWNLISYAKSAFTTTGALGTPWGNYNIDVSVVIGDTSTDSFLVFDDMNMTYAAGTAYGITGLYKYYVPSTVSKNVMVAVVQNSTPKDTVFYKNESTGIWTGFTALNSAGAQTYFCNAYDRCWFVNGDSTDGLQYIDYQTSAAHPTGTITKTKFATIQPAQVCSDICFVANRIFLLGSANITTAAALYNSSTIYYSEPWQSFAITAWNAELIDSDVGGRGRRIVAVNGNILLFKDTAINLIYNLDNDNATSHTISEIRQKRLTDELGTCAPRSVTPSEIGIIFLDRSGVYSTTISEFKYLSKKIQPIFEGKDTTLLGTSVNYGVNKSYIHLACGAYYKHRFYLSYAAGTSTANNKTLIYDPLYDAWTITNWGFSCFYVEKGFDTSGYAEEEKFYGGHPTTNYVYRLDYGSDDNGSVIDMLLKTKQFDFRSPERCKTPEKTIVNYISPSAATLTLYLEADYDTANRKTYSITTTASDLAANEKIIMTDYFSRRKYYNITFSNSDKLVNPIKILSLGIEFRTENYL